MVTTAAMATMALRPLPRHCLSAINSGVRCPQPCPPPLVSSLRQGFPSKLSLCSLLALGLCTIEGLLPYEPAFAEVITRPTEELPCAFMQSVASSPASASHLRVLNMRPCQDSPCVAAKGPDAAAEECLSSSAETSVSAEDYQELLAVNSTPSQNNADFSGLLYMASSEAAVPKPLLDYARVFSPARAASLQEGINALEAEAGWRLRVVTKSGGSISGKDLRDVWKPDDRTVIVIEDISSPNILNFNAGADVIAKLPRQFFLELQSRYGNKFFVEQEGEVEALVSTVGAIEDCLRRPQGCKNVPGLTNDLYYLTLATSIAGGCVFGFAARLPPSGRVEASWQWVVFLSPLWLILFGAFGVLPVVGRTSELEPLIKNAVAFAAAAFALYLTPIFGPSPISKR